MAPRRRKPFLYEVGQRLKTIRAVHDNDVLIIKARYRAPRGDKRYLLGPLDDTHSKYTNEEIAFPEYEEGVTRYYKLVNENLW